MKTWVSGVLVLGISASLSLFSGAQAQKKELPSTTAAPAAAAAKPGPTGAVAPVPGAPSAEALTNAVVKDAKAKPRVIDFEDETIRGTLTKPEGDFIDAARRAKQKSLIQIRRHFVPELLKSADDL